MSAQGDEITSIMERRKISLQDIAEGAALKVSTLKRVISGSYEYDEASMNSIRLLEMKLAGGSGVREHVPRYGAPSKLRAIPVVSWVQAGQAVAFDDLPADWMRTIPTAVEDRNAFAVEIVGDSMEPLWHEGGLATLLPSLAAGTGDLVVANIKNKGAVLKVITHLHEKKKVRLTSLNPAYAPNEYAPTDFHWIYPVESITYKIKRR
jgi:SOS-response transcriptional repressor LexA